jgi:hypothetical protein
MALKNVGASVRARLLRMAQERRDSFEGLLVRYVHERLLYRLSRSAHGSRFTLKGALQSGAPKSLAQLATLISCVAATRHRTPWPKCSGTSVARPKRMVWCSTSSP